MKVMLVVGLLVGAFGVVVRGNDHPALGVMLNSSEDLVGEQAIQVEADDYKAHFLKRGK